MFLGPVFRGLLSTFLFDYLASKAAAAHKSLKYFLRKL
jgi:hypothetical protein